MALKDVSTENLQRGIERAKASQKFAGRVFFAFDCLDPEPETLIDPDKGAYTLEQLESELSSRTPTV